MQGPAAFTWVPIPHSQTNAGIFDLLGGFSQGMYPSNWPFPQTQPLPNSGGTQSVIGVGGIQGSEQQKVDDNIGSKSSSVKEDSIKKRARRANQREAEEEMRRRESAGLKPYAVQVRSSGLIDSGCKGHLKWQELVRDITPRMLDMSVIKYEDQEESSRKVLRETMFNKFEFIDHEVTDVSFAKMIKTWLRRDRERVRRLHGEKQKAPSKYTDSQWTALKKYWDSPAYKRKSEKMSETRSKVVYNPRLGRHGYAGHEAKLVSLFTRDSFESGRYPWMLVCVRLSTETLYGELCFALQLGYR